MSEDRYWNLFDLKRYAITHNEPVTETMDRFYVTLGDPNDITLEFLSDEHGKIEEFQQIPLFYPRNGIQGRSFLELAKRRLHNSKKASCSALDRVQASDMFMISVYSQAFSDMILHVLPMNLPSKGSERLFGTRASLEEYLLPSIIHLLENGGLEMPSIEVPDFVRKNIYKNHEYTPGAMVINVPYKETGAVLCIDNVIHPYQVYDRAYEISQMLWGNVSEDEQEMIKNVRDLEGKSAAYDQIPLKVKEKWQEWFEEKTRNDPCFSELDFLNVTGFPEPGFIEVSGKTLLNASLAVLEGDHHIEWRPNHALILYAQNLVNQIEEAEEALGEVLVPTQKDIGEPRTSLMYKILIDALWEYGYQ